MPFSSSVCFFRGETVPPSLVTDRSFLSRVLSIKLLAKIGFSLNIVAIAWSFCGIATGYYHDHGDVEAELVALHVAHFGFGILMVLVSINSAVVGFQVVRMFFNITKDVQRHQATRTVSASFVTSAKPAGYVWCFFVVPFSPPPSGSHQLFVFCFFPPPSPPSRSTSNLVQSDLQLKPGEYTQQVLWGDIVKMATINLLIATILLLYGIGCILLAGWGPFWTTDPFIFVIGCMSINGSCITASVAMIFLVYM